MASKREKEKPQQIRVFVRSRPINNQEREGRSLNVIDISNNRELIVKQQHNKRYNFDKIFGPNAKQIEVYMSVVHPLISEVLSGYNCTVFAYGQTGTGKTFTMAGGSVFTGGLTWQDDENAGIIPRALAHLFDELRLITQDYTVRVSYLELYNEELYDLLSETDDGNRIRIYEDQRQKGSVIIQGIEEQTVHNKNEVYRILEKGQEKRRTASTLMNAQSSRSHTVFSITVHTRETNIDGEELVKVGKLNLVDLAGSENISRSGAVDVRAREAGNINQSLLTLGRVIKALVERSAHVPYRESKLTRILQDSLGGRTKTSIIATISPASSCLEETLSTLDYANRARNIINRPEVNQKMCQKLIITQYTDEIERLKKDLSAARNGTAVCLAPENYERLIVDSEIQKEEIAEKINHIRNLEQQLKDTEEQKEAVELEWKRLRFSFNETKRKLRHYHNKLKITMMEKKEQEHLANHYEANAKSLHKHAETFLDMTEVSVKNETIFHSKIEHIRNLANTNISTFQKAKNSVEAKYNDLVNGVEEYSQYQDEKNKQILELLVEIKSRQLRSYEENVSFMTKLMQEVENSSGVVGLSLSQQRESDRDLLVTIINQFKYHTDTLKNICKQSMEETCNMIESKVVEDKAESQRFCNTIVSNIQDITSAVDSAFTDSKTDIDNMVKEFIDEHEQLSQMLTLQESNTQSLNTKLDQLISHATACKKQLHENATVHNNTQRLTNKIGNGIFKNASLITKNIETSSKNIGTKSVEFRKIVEENSKQEQLESDTFLKELQACSTIKYQQLDNICESVENDVEVSGSNIMKNVDTSFNKCKTVLEANKDNIKGIGNKQLEVTKELYSQLQSKTNQTMAELNELKTSTLEFTNSLPDDVYECQENLNNCIENDIIPVNSNGDTPLRRNFRYPNDFGEVSSKETILSGFRQQNENNLMDISGISIESDSFLNSSVSTSDDT